METLMRAVIPLKEKVIFYNGLFPVATIWYRFCCLLFDTIFIHKS